MIAAEIAFVGPNSGPTAQPALETAQAPPLSDLKGVAAHVGAVQHKVPIITRAARTPNSTERTRPRRQAPANSIATVRLYAGQPDPPVRRTSPRRTKATGHPAGHEDKRALGRPSAPPCTEVRSPAEQHPEETSSAPRPPRRARSWSRGPRPARGCPPQGRGPDKGQPAGSPASPPSAGPARRASLNGQSAMRDTRPTGAGEFGVPERLHEIGPQLIPSPSIIRPEATAKTGPVTPSGQLRAGFFSHVHEEIGPD